ncbi:TPA: hypothetical protein SAP13_005238 [Burkholderia multivorans]|nr:hypothetical protein [Burkholderia multivorans]
MASHTGNPGGRPKSRFLDWLRTRAWLAHLKKTLAAQTDNALKERLEKHGFTFPVSKYLAGVDFPKQTTRTLVGKLKRLERASLVYDIGPEVDGENVPLWRLFEEVRARFLEAKIVFMWLVAYDERVVKGAPSGLGILKWVLKTVALNRS